MAPAPPGRAYGDYGDEALRIARTLLHEALDLRRSGVVAGPRFTLVLPRGGPRDAAARGLLRQALAAAAEGGDPRIVLDEPGAPSRGSGWLRVREEEALDPLRFDRGDVSVATTTALNLAAVAVRVADRADGAWRGEVDHLASLAAEGMVARRALLEQRADEPGGVLYPVRRGPFPLVDLEGAHHVVEPVGLDRAVVLLHPAGDPEGRRDLRRRILSHLRARVVEEGRSRGLPVAVVEGLSPNVAARLARLDARRYADASAWWPRGQAPNYAPRPPATGAVGREPIGPDLRRGTVWRDRARHRVDGDRRPPTDSLLAALEVSERDAAVAEHVVDPWPRRHLRAEAADR